MSGCGRGFPLPTAVRRCRVHPLHGNRAFSSSPAWISHCTGSTVTQGVQATQGQKWMVLASSAALNPSSPAGAAMFRSTVPLRFSFLSNKHFTAREAIDVHHETAMRNENPFSAGVEASIDWNLLQDPTGGLDDEMENGSAEELSEQELMEEIESRRVRYNEEEFFLLFTPLIDLFGILMDHRLLPESAPRKPHELALRKKQALQKKEMQKAEEEQAKQMKPLKTGKQEEEAMSTPSSTPKQVVENPSVPTDTPDTTHRTTSPAMPVEAAATEASSPSTPSNSPPHRRSLSDAASTVVSNWFLDGQSALSRPDWTAQKMGPERYRIFITALKKQYESLEPALPLPRLLRRHPFLPYFILLPFLRQLSLDMHSTDRRAAAVKVVPAIIISLANGRVVPHYFGFPGTRGSSLEEVNSTTDGTEKAISTDATMSVEEQRVRLVTELFMAVAQETGNSDLAYLALQLLRANGLTVPFTLQRQLTNVFSTAARISTDWRVRSAGVLAECLPKWKAYWRRVKSDVCRQWLKEEQREHLAPSEPTLPDGTPSPLPGTRSSSTSHPDVDTKSLNIPKEEMNIEVEKKRTEKKDKKVDQPTTGQSSDELTENEKGSTEMEEHQEGEVASYFSRKGKAEGLSPSSISSAFSADPSQRTDKGKAHSLSASIEHHIKTAVRERVRVWATLESQARATTAAGTAGSSSGSSVAAGKKDGHSQQKGRRSSESMLMKEVLEQALRCGNIDNEDDEEDEEYEEEEEEEEEAEDEEEEEEEEEDEEEEDEEEVEVLCADEEEEEEEEEEEPVKELPNKKGKK